MANISQYIHGWSKHQFRNWTWAPPWFANLHTRQLPILKTQATQWWVYKTKMHQLQDMSGCSDTVSWWNDDNATIGSQPHLSNRDNIVASQFREGQRGNVTERDVDLKAIYNNLADLFALTHSPRIREIISPSFLAFPSPGRIERRHGGETRSHVLMYRVIYGF